MLETAQVSSTAVLRFASSSSEPSTGGGSSSDSATGIGPLGPNSTSSMGKEVWQEDNNNTKVLSPSESSKFSPIKLEPADTFETTTNASMASQHSSGGSFTELKPLPFDYASSSVPVTLDPVLSNRNTNPTSNGPIKATVAYSQQNSNQDVTSSGSSSPPGITKLETLDFTASQDAFDDLASIVGISMGADSTVPNIDCDSDLDAWIENTAQNIKPLVGGDSNLDAILPQTPSSVAAAAAAAAAAVAITHRLSNGPNVTAVSQSQPQVYLPMSSMPSSTTLQSLLQGNLSPGPPPPGCKVTTHLQPRADLHGPQTSSLPPPPYSILQNRLQHGGNNLATVKVDSTFEIMKVCSENNNNSSSSNSYLSSVAAGSYADSLPHSTQTPINNHVTTTDPSLHRRLGELGGLAKFKAKHNKMRQKLGLVNGAGGPSAGLHSGGVHGSASTGQGGGGGVVGSGVDHGKKVMHHCPICSRSFLNKSNIKVHLRTHTGEKPFKCEHCAKAFRQKAHLLKHMSIHKRISRD